MKADFALDYDVVTVERERKLYLMARLVAGAAPGAEQRRPLNLSLVLDRSGSMAGDKLSFTRQAAQFLVQNLGVNDLLSIVLYNENVEVLLPPERIVHKDAVNQRLSQIKAGGMTNLSGGWLQGCSLVEQNLRHDALNRVILMSDGLANRGITQPEKLVALAHQKRGARVTTSTMGLGEDFNEDLMMAMADAGGGAFYFIESPEVAPLIFQEELRGLLNVVGQNLTVTLVPSDDISNVNQLNAYNMHSDGRSISFSLGDVFGDEVKTLILEISVPALHEIGQRQIALLRFSFDEVTESGVQHQTLELPVMVHVSDQEGAGEANAAVRESVLLLQAAKARREAVSAADKGDYERASQTLRQAAGVIEDAKLDSKPLVEEHEALVKQSEEMKRGAEFYDKYSRKSMATQAIYTMTDRHESTQFFRSRESERSRVPEIERKEGTNPTHLTWGEHTYPIQSDLIRIGRAPQNEIVLVAKNVSRFHCQIKREGERLLLEDLGSTNGTFLNDVLLREAMPLNVGDIARVGHEQIVFHDHG
jgi:Ca-activated chloride channel family protein